MCPLCFSDHVYPLDTVSSKTYWRCHGCLLTFLSQEHHLEPHLERARYTLHENNPEDPRYRSFLSKLTEQLVPRLPRGAEGLDYGSGPGPTLSVMLTEQRFRMAIYDPYFAPDTEVLGRTYDFITCTETAEHFFRPGDTFQQLDRLLRRSGWLGVLTEILEPDISFPDWWYPRDPTHVCFYAKETMGWIAHRFSWKVEYPQKNVTLFHKP